MNKRIYVKGDLGLPVVFRIKREYNTEELYVPDGDFAVQKHTLIKLNESECLSVLYKMIFSTSAEDLDGYMVEIDAHTYDLMVKCHSLINIDKYKVIKYETDSIDYEYVLNLTVDKHGREVIGDGYLEISSNNAELLDKELESIKKYIKENRYEQN